jgi:hypothetical protein
MNTKKTKPSVFKRMAKRIVSLYGVFFIFSKKRELERIKIFILS